MQYLRPLAHDDAPKSSGRSGGAALPPVLDHLWADVRAWWAAPHTHTSTATSDQAAVSTDSTDGDSPRTRQPADAAAHDALQKGINLLKQAADMYGHKDALFSLADLYFYEKYGQTRDLKQAFHFYHKMADLGNATAQHMVGFMYATGFGNVVPRDQAQALLYHTFAAHGANTAAEMTLGYRYLLGIGTEQKCSDAVYYYKNVAAKAIDHYLSGPPGGRAMPLPKVRLSDQAGGVYGFGASMVMDKPSWTNSDNSVSIEEVLQYLRYLALVKGDVEAQLMLGDMYYYGSRNVPQNFQEALTFFKAVVERLPTSGRKIPDTVIKSKSGEAIGQAAGYLGKMFMRGEGVQVNYQTAYKWFLVGAELQDSASMNGLGLLLLKGKQEDYDRAIDYFTKASNLKNADARVNLALEYIKHESTFDMGIQLFNLAADSKHLLAYWYLGQMYQEGIGMTAPSCQHAVAFYKAIAERGDWLYPTVETAYKAYEDGDLDGALLHYMLAAERGYEIAQANVAYLLDTHYVAQTLPQRLGLQQSRARDTDLEQLALIYWSRSANQNNVDARVKMGDYYYFGIGAPTDFEKAAACYRVAAELENSPMAMWNLGWMYEHGIGVARDFHLAKRTYDNALVANGNAYLPVKLSLLKLYLRQYVDFILGRDVDHPLFQTKPKNGANDAYPAHAEQAQHRDPQHAGDAHGHQLGEHPLDDFSEQRVALEQARRRKEIEGHDALWDRGAEEELRRQYNRHMRELEDQDDAAFRRYDDDEEDDEYSEEEELIESIIILGICILVGYLVYIRRHRVNNNNPVAQQQQQQHPPAPPHL
ncbi:hypothetical protein BC940DRAFT_232578 [Gongronella butleri]|nr:hypothetical protein BC940DRAFT_232578 [Gongronella butleri]